MHIDWESRANDKALVELLERRRYTGGRIVVYQRVVSFIVFSRLSNHYCLVSPYENRSWRGLVFFLPTFFTGWWSFSGVLHTCYALAHDVLGGIDVTEQVVEPKSPPNLKQDAAFARKRFALCLAFVAVLLLLVVAWFVFAVMK
jgi:hypothetical protein